MPEGSNGDIRPPAEVADLIDCRRIRLRPPLDSGGRFLFSGLPGCVPYGPYAGLRYDWNRLLGSSVATEADLRRREEVLETDMPTAEKEEKIRQTVEDLKTANAVWVVDYRGLTVNQSETLRRQIRETGSSMKVLKNTLTKRALSEAELPTLDDILSGPSAFIFAEGDPSASAKVIRDFAKDNPQLEIKGGIMEGREVDADDVMAIADLPTRDELLSMLLRTLQGPATGLVRVLNGPMEAFARAVSAIADTKEAA